MLQLFAFAALCLVVWLCVEATHLFFEERRRDRIARERRERLGLRRWEPGFVPRHHDVVAAWLEYERSVGGDLPSRVPGRPEQRGEEPGRP